MLLPSMLVQLDEFCPLLVWQGGQNFQVLPGIQTLTFLITTVPKMVTQTTVSFCYNWKKNQCLPHSFLLKNDHSNSDFAQEFLLSLYNLVALLGFNYSTFNSVPIFCSFRFWNIEYRNIDTLNVPIPSNATKIKRHPFPKELSRIGHYMKFLPRVWHIILYYQR